MAVRWRPATLVAVIALLGLTMIASVSATEAEVTIGFLPQATRSAEVMIRGAAPTGRIVALSVNGELQARVYTAEEMSIYRGIVPLEPGLNVVTAHLKGSESVATATLYRVTTTFTDVESEPLRDDIEILATLGIVSGDGSGRFWPSESLSRAELAKVLTLALQLEEADPSNLALLADADAIPDWALNYVATAYHHGLLRGYPDGTFRPRASVTRAELIAAVLRTIPPEIVGQHPGRSFQDEDHIHEWVRPLVDPAVRYGLIESFWGESFRGDSPLQRRDAAAVIRRLIDLRR